MALTRDCVKPLLGYNCPMSDDLHFKLRISPQLMDALKADAERKRRSVTSLIVEFIEKGLQSPEESEAEDLRAVIETMWTHIHKLEAKVHGPDFPWLGDFDPETLKEPPTLKAGPAKPSKPRTSGKK
jgi:hypothetical protein